MEDTIIQLEDGYNEVKQKGVDPFLRLVEMKEREFFKAKDFVALYEYVFSVLFLVTSSLMT